MTDAERLEAIREEHRICIDCDPHFLLAELAHCEQADADSLAEVERLRGVVERMREAYDQKVDDFAKETLRVDALLKAAHYDGGPHMVGEAGLGWNAAMKHVRAALAELERA